MGLYQTANDLEEIISGERPFAEDERSVKQMLIDNGEWTEEDEDMEFIDEYDRDYSDDYPLGGSIERYDIEIEKELTN